MRSLLAPRSRAESLAPRGELLLLRLVDWRFLLLMAASSANRLGLPMVDLDWRVSDCDLASVREGVTLLGNACAVAGIGRVLRPHGDDLPSSELVQGDWHQMGTTRMSRDPRSGVVDTDCRVHGIANLFVAGSSVYPSYGSANPTLTIVALAHRLADLLRARLSAVPTVGVLSPAPPSPAIVSR